MENAVVFKNDGIELKLGDFLILKNPSTDTSFQTSEIGKLFKNGHCDTAKLEVKQKPWLEIYFELTLHREGENVPIHDDDFDMFSEDVDYNFTRYLIKKGASKI